MRHAFTLAMAIGLGACAAGSSGGSDFDDTKSSYIVNGESAGTSFPTVGFLASPEGRPFCTGTIIGPRTVLTAGHCVNHMGRTIPASDVRFGQGASSSSATFTDVSAVILHPSYVGAEIPENDVALLTLASDVSQTPSPLYEPAVAVGSEMTLVGYGITNGTTNVGLGEKRHANVSVARIDTNTWRYQTTSGRSACRGDSGGPAFFDVGGTLHVAGVTSWGDPACTSFGNYTRIDVFHEFIRAGMAPAGTETTPGGTPTPPPIPTGDGAEPADGEDAPADTGDAPADAPDGTGDGTGGAAGGAGCEDTCPWAGDGECDDGGPGSDYAVCPFGTDCRDCGPRDGSAPPPPSGGGGYPPPPSGTGSGGSCTNTCCWAGDGQCDDGGPGSDYSVCMLGTDCMDCGPR